MYIGPSISKGKTNTYSASVLPVIVRARLKHGELYALQLRATALFRQHLEVIVVGLSQTEWVFPRALIPSAVAGAYVPNSAAMFSEKQFAADGGEKKKQLDKIPIVIVHGNINIDVPVVLSGFGLLPASRALATSSMNRICARMTGERQHLAHLSAGPPVLVALGLQFLAEFLE